MVLMVGRLNAAEAYKGHAEVIEAWPAVVARCPAARLTIAGEGDDRARLETLARSTGVAGSIEFTGFVSNAALERLYERAAIFALPSRGEGFGIVYLEAMAHALPCLASRHDAAGDVVADGATGFLVDQHDREEIAMRIVTLLTQPDLRGRMGRAGVVRVQQEFSFARFSSGLIDLLEARLEHSA
jgi:phosphatidylinositol alpha-1,6-mannosyltransferase